MVYTQYVDSLFVQVDVNKTGMIQGTEAVPFLSQSGLAKESLRDVYIYKTMFILLYRFGQFHQKVKPI